MHPTLVTLGRFELPAYGVLVASGIVVGTVVAWLLARRSGVGPDFVVDAVFWIVLCGFAGARLAFMAVNWAETLRNPLCAAFSNGGGVFLAGGVCGTLALWGVCRRYAIPFASGSDVLAPAVALAHACGRVGCFLSGCCYGRVAVGVAPWAGVRFPKQIASDGSLSGSWPYLDHLRSGLVSRSDACSLPVYPVQLIEAVFNLLVFLGLLVVWRKKTRSGQVVVAYLLLYPAGRFVLEFLRGDADRGMWLGLSLSQWSCLVILAVAVPLGLRVRHAPQ